MSELTFEQQRDAALTAFMNGETNDFDMYAVDPVRTEWIDQIIPGMTISSAGGMCPFQAYGTLHGLVWYYRERHGCAELRVARAKAESHCWYESLYDAGEAVEEFRSGAFWLDTLVNLVATLERSEFMWEFPSNEVIWDDPKSMATVRPGPVGKTTIKARGATPEQALARLHEFHFNSYWAENGGIDEAAQRWYHRVETFAVFPIPCNADPRVWPSPEPAFEVIVPDAEGWGRDQATGRIITPWAPAPETEA